MKRKSWPLLIVIILSLTCLLRPAAPPIVVVTTAAPTHPAPTIRKAIPEPAPSWHKDKVALRLSRQCRKESEEMGYQGVRSCEKLEKAIGNKAYLKFMCRGTWGANEDMVCCSDPGHICCQDYEGKYCPPPY